MMPAEVFQHVSATQRDAEIEMHLWVQLLNAGSEWLHVSKSE